MGKTYCIFSANYLPHLGGVERYTYNLSSKLKDKGNRVIIVTSNTYNLASYEKIDNLEIFRVPCFNVLNGRFPVLKYNSDFRKLFQKLMKISVDCVIVNTRFYVHSFLGVYYAKKKNIKPIVIEHGTNHFTVNNKVLDVFGHIYEHFISNVIKRYCNNFYGVSKSCVSWLKHFGIPEAGILYNAIDVNQVNDLLNNPVTNYKKEMNLNQDSIIITYTGRLVKEKGILKLIEAFDKLLKENPNIYLFIAGDGELYDKLKKINNQNIIILGRIDFNHIVALLGQTDIFCLPTDYPEGFPTSVLEAACCKCYIITTNAGGSKELIINDDYGTVIEENSIDVLYNCLKKAINSKEERLEAVNLTYKRLVDNFTWDIVADKVMKLE